GRALGPLLLDEVETCVLEPRLLDLLLVEPAGAEHRVEMRARRVVALLLERDHEQVVLRPAALVRAQAVEPQPRKLLERARVVTGAEQVLRRDEYVARIGRDEAGDTIAAVFLDRPVLRMCADTQGHGGEAEQRGPSPRRTQCRRERCTHGRKLCAPHGQSSSSKRKIVSRPTRSTAVPPSMRGRYRHRETAASAALSKSFSGCDARTRASLTVPSAATLNRTRTQPSIFLVCRRGGYVGSTR